jgi:hypothetical protein
VQLGIYQSLINLPAMHRVCILRQASNVRVRQQRRHAAALIAADLRKDGRAVYG